MKRVLVANRGEIALRIVRACHEEGLEAVAVYSEADHLAPHVRAADQAVAIGPAPASESYLQAERLIGAALGTGCDALHPGYGFLSERASFASAVEEVGLAFVGPTPAATHALGDKLAARRLAAEIGVPVVPGTEAPVSERPDFRALAARVGLPLLLKAAAGGGGKGMRLVRTESDLGPALTAAASEASAAFGDGRIYAERLIEGARHVEIQLLADGGGRVVHLGERECSIQRRHQKLIEESPSPAVGPALRSELGASAVRLAAAAGYRSAGTCEFLLAPTGEFYFLEVNARLQVEHPVTEMVYGVDLVREQLRIAAGRPLAFSQEELVPRGWAIECRITAEDPAEEFLPATGEVAALRLPSGPGVRWDGALEPGSRITPFYDSLLGKLVVWAESRERAIARMARALDELLIVGVPTCQAFHRRVMDEPEFRRGALDITYWERIGRALMARGPDPAVMARLVVAAALLQQRERHGAAARDGGDGAVRGSPWLEAARREGLR